MTTLQEMIAKTPAGQTLDLKNGTYTVGEDPQVQFPARIRKPLTIVGEGATIAVASSPLRSRPALAVRGPGVKLLGDVTVQAIPASQRDDLEAQHGIEFQGSVDTVCEWKVRDVQGTSYYVGKDPTKVAGTGWTTNIVIKVDSARPGRQHVALQAVKGFILCQPIMDTCGSGHSSIVFEANGHDWGCQDGLIENGIYMGNTGWCLSAGSGYPHQADGCFSNVTMQHMVSETVFGINIGSPGNRMGPFTADDCRGGAVANVTSVRCSHVDGLTVTNYHQRLTIPVPWKINDCPGAVLTMA